MIKTSPVSVEEVQKQILNAAESRFRTFGYNKTTMAEIAQDCHMSTSNLYRFFENKQDIGEGCVLRCYAELEESLQKVVRQNGESLKERIEEFFLANMEYYHFLLTQFPPIYELMVSMVNERKELIQHHLERKAEWLSKMLTEGNQSGELNIEDVDQTAKVLLNCTAKFTTARNLAFDSCTLEERRAQLKDVMKLLFKGLDSR